MSTLSWLNSQTGTFTLIWVSLREIQPALSSSEHNSYLRHTQPVQLHFRFVRCHREETIKSLKSILASKVVQLKKKSLMLVKLVDSNVYNPPHPCATPTVIQKIPEQTMSSREFLPGSSRYNSLSPTIWPPHARFRQRWAERTAVSRCSQPSKSCREGFSGRIRLPA